MALIVLFAAWSTNHTNILDVYGGGGKLFGGTYLILYYFGMLIEKHKWLRKTMLRKSILFLLTGAFAFILLWTTVNNRGRIFLDQRVPFGDGFNPPSLSLMGQGVSMLFLCYGFFSLLEQFHLLSWVTQAADWIGRYTLDIFLYHRLFMYFLTLVGFTRDLQINIWLFRVLYFLILIFGSMLIGGGVRILIGKGKLMIVQKETPVGED